MIKKEFKRLFVSWATPVFVLIQCAAALVNYCSESLAWKQTLLNMLAEAPADVDLAKVSQFLGEMNGYEFFYSYYDYSDAVYFGIILAFAWLGIFVSSRALRQRAGGYGNYIVSRMNFGAYYRLELAAQTLYIAAVWAIAFALQLILAFALGGISGTGYYDLTPLQCAGMAAGMYVVFVFYFSCVNIIASSLMFFIRSGLVIRALPVVIFALVPLILGDFIMNRLGVPDRLAILFSPYNYLLAIPNMPGSSAAKETLILLFLSMAIALFAALLIWRINSLRMRKNYV